MANRDSAKVLFLRISYWVGAILDAAWVIPMVFPRVGGSLFGIENFQPDAVVRYALAVGAALMLGWTVLLLWADRKPVERRGVILLTVVPVKVCLDAAALIPPVLGVISWTRYLLMEIDAPVLYVLFIFAYVYEEPGEERSFTPRRWSPPRT